ncbi:hypothetical protein D3C79_898740 [compost metagenome]
MEEPIKFSSFLITEVLESLLVIDAPLALIMVQCAVVYRIGALIFSPEVNGMTKGETDEPSSKTLIIP